MIKILTTIGMFFLLATGVSAASWGGSGTSWSTGGSAGGALGASAFYGITASGTSSFQGSDAYGNSGADINGGYSNSGQTSGGNADQYSGSLGFAGSISGSAYGGFSQGWGQYSFGN